MQTRAISSGAEWSRFPLIKLRLTFRPINPDVTRQPRGCREFETTRLLPAWKRNGRSNFCRVSTGMQAGSTPLGEHAGLAEADLCPYGLPTPPEPAMTAGVSWTTFFFVGERRGGTRGDFP